MRPGPSYFESAHGVVMMGESVVSYGDEVEAREAMKGKASQVATGFRSLGLDVVVEEIETVSQPAPGRLYERPERTIGYKLTITRIRKKEV